ncbi:MAG: dTMP kinase, partial [Actinomycetota bacterium]
LVQQLGGGGTGWGILITTFGIGMAGGLLSVNAVGKVLDREHVFYLSMIGGGITLCLLAMAPGVGYAAALAVPLGFLVGLTWVLGYTLLQESVSDVYRGRTFSTLNILSKLGLLACLVLFPAIGTAAGASDLWVVSLNDGWSFALLLAGVAVVLGGLYTRVGLYRYRMMKPRALGLIPKLKKAPVEGVFVAFEGVEGSGKGTQIDLAEKALGDEGYHVMVTREPGGTQLGERLREMLLDPETGRIEPRTEALLFGAARSQMVSTVIRPALESGKVVICDRYIDSSVAYQGFARGVGETDVLSLNVWATQGLFPDLVVLLHVEPEEGLRRAGAGE